MLRLTILTALFLSASVLVCAQSLTPTPTPRGGLSSGSADNQLSIPRTETEISRADDGSEFDSGDFRPLSPIELSKPARQKIKLTREEKARFKPLADAADMNILKMFSAPECAAKPLVLDASASDCAAAADVLRVSFYSFRRGFYGERIADFRILGNEIIVGNGRYEHGFLVDLGETELSRIDKRSAEVVALNEYPIAKTIADESKQRTDLLTSIPYRDFAMSSRLKIKNGHVYLMRLVSYGFRNDRGSPFFYRDRVYVLTVEEPTPDRTSIVLWRKLTERAAPMLKD